MGSNAEPSVRSGCWQGLKGKTLSKVRASALRYFTYCMQCPTRSKLIAQALCEMPQCMPHDFFFISGVFFMRFLSLVLERSFLPFFQFLGAFGGPKGSFLVSFCKKVPLFLKRWDPRFCTPLHRFGLIFRVWDLPGRPKNEKKQLPNYHRFFDMEKRPPKQFFVILMCFLVSFWGAFWSTLGAFWSTFGKCCCFSLGVSRGPLRDRFWLHFWIILHRFYEHVWCNVGGVFCGKCGFTCISAHFFKSFYLFIRLFPVGRHFTNSSCTCMGAQFSRIRLRF
jgi:hypothetical protein